jgi:hypothetical protein
MPERHKGNIVRLYADDSGQFLADLLKHGTGTTVFTFEVPGPGSRGREQLTRFLELALVHALPCIITESNRMISHVELTRFG